MSKKYDYSKSDIANIVEEFKALLAEHECTDDVHNAFHSIGEYRVRIGEFPCDNFSNEK